MFTWNIQYISKTRLSDALKQSMLDAERGDILSGSTPPFIMLKKPLTLPHLSRRSFPKRTLSEPVLPQ